jgi:hypothetical protein
LCRQALPGCNVDQLGNNRSSADVDGDAEHGGCGITFAIFLAYIGQDLRAALDAFGEDSLLEKSGMGGNGYDKIVLNSVLAGQHWAAVRREFHGTLSADALAATGCVQDYAGLAGRLQKRIIRTNTNLPAVRLKNYLEMFHLLCRVYRIAGILHNTQYARCVANHPLILWRIFHFVCLFLLPILRLRLGFPIHISKKSVTIIITERF